MTQRCFIGLSSGSGLSGVDAALVRVDGAGLGMKPRLLHFVHQAYPRDVRGLLRGVASSAPAPVRTVALLHRLLGELFAGSVRLLADEAKFDLRHVLCIGCSGHTLWHEPDCRYPTTLNIGLASAVAERTGLTTLSDPRAQDVVVGGHGVPLTPLADWLLFRDPAEARVLVHLGGTATVSALPASATPKQVAGFQAAPCCLLLDGFMQRLTGGKEPFDAFGKHAVQGRCIEPLLERWLAHPLLQRRPPRVMSRRDFGDEFIEQAVQAAKQTDRSLHDLLCTATHFVARSIIEALRRFVPWSPARVLVSGGGVRNGFLWRLLEQHLTPTPLAKLDLCGIPSEARKAVAFAALAALTVDGVPGNLPGVTGASGPRLLGSFTPGTPENWSRCLGWMARQAATPRLAA
ncbi:MAG: anhydro-N-acetylmuramic acid kinase [Gemmataceae bacterium]|nr:anhydro-N-acetylmuramic acid kinase [Gemmataceae bacterium]